MDAFDHDPYIRARQLEILKSYMRKSGGKIRVETFTFILAQLPTKVVANELVRHLKLGKEKNLRLDTIAEKLNQDWFTSPDQPSYAAEFFRLIDKAIAGFRETGESVLRSNLIELCNMFKLEDDDAVCIETIHLIELDDDFESAINAGRYGFGKCASILNQLLLLQGISTGRVRQSAARLRALQIIDANFGLEPHITDYLYGMSKDPLSTSLFKPTKAVPLALSDFECFRKDIDFILDLVRGRVEGGPLHILFYGSPGTGKTALSHALAGALGRQLYEVQHSQDGNWGRRGGTPGARMTAIKACSNAVDAGSSIILIDEADDLLNHSMVFNEDSHKEIINDLLDTTRLVCIWITSHSRGIEPSTRRRFDYSLDFKDMSRNSVRCSGEIALSGKD